MNLNDFKSHNQVIGNPNNENIYRIHMNEISRFRPLSREEEIKTFKRVEIGDQEAINKICKHNLLFVVTVAKKYSAMIGKSSITLEDLISEGNLGLLRAIKKFDYRTKNKFISYAVWWIKQGILASIQDNVKNIRLPISVKGEINKLNRKKEKLTQELGRTPTTTEIFDSMVIDGEMTTYINKMTVDELFKINNYETSLSNLISHDGTVELGDLIVSEDPNPSDILIEKQRKELLMVMIGKLPRHAQIYLIEFYGIGVPSLSIKQMSEKYELSTTTIKQCINKYIRKLQCMNSSWNGFFAPTSGYCYNR